LTAKAQNHKTSGNFWGNIPRSVCGVSLQKYHQRVRTFIQEPDGPIFPGKKIGTDENDGKKDKIV
jgi:hypothetical protein